MNSWKRSAGIFLVGASAVLLGGCDKIRTLFGTAEPHKNNLHYVKCEGGIIQVNPTNGIDPDNEIVFLCPGQKLSWAAPSGLTFSIVFSESPFESNDTSVNQNTGEEKVSNLKVNQKSKDFKYTLSVSGLQPMDPHVIVMGP